MSQFLTLPPIPTPHLTLKVALVVGVRVHFGSQLRDLQGLRVTVSADADADVPTGSPGPSASRAVNEPRAEVLIDASGGRCDLFRRFGFKQARAAAASASAPATRHRTPSANSRQTASVICRQELVFKSARAIGLVCHLHNGRSREESPRSRQDLADTTRSGEATGNHLYTTQENEIPEGNWASQFYNAKFTALRAAGVDLQNMVRPPAWHAQ